MVCFRLIICLWFCFLGTGIHVTFAENTEKLPLLLELNNGWMFTSGIVQPDQTVNVNWNRAVTMDNPLKSDEYGKQLTFRLKIPQLACNRCMLYLSYIQRDFRIYWNGELIDEQGIVDSIDTQSHFIRDIKYYFVDGNAKKENELLIHARTDTEKIGIMSPMMIGDSNELLTYFDQLYVRSFLIAILAGFTGIIVIFIYYPIRRGRIYLYFGMATTVISLYLLSANHLIHYKLNVNEVLYYLEYYTFYIMPFFLALYVKNIFMEKLRWPIILFAWHWLFFGWVLLDQWIFGSMAHVHLLLGQINFLVTMIALVVASVWYAFRGGAEAKIVSVIFFFTFSFVGFDAVNSIIFNNNKLILSQYAALIFIVAQIYIFVRRVQEMNHQLERMNLTLENQVHERTGKVKTLLDQSGQGFLTFDRQLIVENEFSAACMIMFGYSPAGKNVVDLLWPESNGEREMVNGLLIELFESKNVSAMGPFFELIPNEIHLNGLTIGCTCRPLAIENGRLVKILFVLDDLTGQRQLETQLKMEEKLMRMIVNVLSMPRDFRELVYEYRQFVLDDIVNWTTENANLKDHYMYVMRMTHTFKGNFAQFGSFLLADQFQQLENVIERKVQPISIEWLNTIKCLDWISALDEEIRRMKEMIPMAWLDNQVEEIAVDRAVLVSLRNRVREKLSGELSEELSDAIERLYQQPFRKLFEPLVNYAEQMAGRLEKWIDPIQVKGGEFLIDHDQWRTWAKTLVHVVRNQIDHGIEDADTRLEMGKNESGKIEIGIEQHYGEIQVIFRDDGAGINYARLREKVIEKELATILDVASKSDAQMNDYLFVDSVSTREIVNEWSGRGVGLAAVKVETEKLGGRIEVRSVRGQYTEMKFIFG